LHVYIFVTVHIFFLLPPAAAKKEKGFFGDTPNPGKGLRPLHSLPIERILSSSSSIDFFH